MRRFFPQGFPYAPFALIVGVRLVFLLTYPPNTAGDMMGYWHMLIHGRSNLVFAPGYPFLVGLPFRLALAITGRSWWITAHEGAVQYAVVGFQHLLSVAALVCLYSAVHRVFGRLAAMLSVLWYGLWPPGMAVVSCFFPEWLQADLVIVTLCLAVHGFFAVSPRVKLALYGAMFAVFAWSYLVKYNAMFLAVMLPVPVLLDSLRWRWKAATLALGSLVATAIVAGFVVGFHAPYTGTRVLSRDHAWVLLTALGQWVPDGRLSPETGLWTKRLIYLNSVLPWHPERVGPFWHDDDTEVSRAFRAPWRERYLHVLSDDDGTLDALLASAPPQPVPYDFFAAFFPSYQHLGMAEGDQLGVAVFLENVRAHPLAFLRNVTGSMLSATWRWPIRRLYDKRLDEPDYTPAGRWGIYRRNQGERPALGRVWYKVPRVWRPGVTMTRLLDACFCMPTFLVSLAVLAHFGVCAVEWFKGRRDRLRGGVILLTLLCVWFAGCSSAIFFRWKEAFVAFPFGVVLFSVALARAGEAVREHLAPRQPVVQAEHNG